MTAPERPKRRISARPITKGGVMIGSTDSARRSGLAGNAVRVAISAKARPRTVVPAPTRTARNSVFQATPQRSGPSRQSRPQIDRFASLSRKTAGASAPPSSRTALESTVTTGQKTKTTTRPITRPIVLVRKASPFMKPRAARPWQRSTRNARQRRNAPSAEARLAGPGGAEERSRARPPTSRDGRWPSPGGRSTRDRPLPPATSTVAARGSSFGRRHARNGRRSGNAVGRSHGRPWTRPWSKAGAVAASG